MMTFYSLKLVDKFCSSVDILSKIDDPLDAFAVHYGGGLCGVLLTPVFMKNGVVNWKNCETQLADIKVCDFVSYGGRLCGGPKFFEKCIPSKNMSFLKISAR